MLRAAQPTRIITHIIIHCAATANGKAVSAGDIDEWHRQRGFKRHDTYVDANYPLAHIGYHFVINVDGSVTQGRRIDEVGAHTKGYNSRSIGICLVGISEYSAAQWSSLKQLVNELRQQCPDINTITGHRDLSPDKNGDGKISPNEWVKNCPGFSVSDWLSGGMQPLLSHLYVGGIAAINRPTPEPAAEPAANAETFTGVIAQLDSKPWWQSKTILAAIAAGLPSLAHLAGIDQALLAPYAGDIMTVIAALLAIIGRATAKQPVATRGQSVK